MSVEVASMSLTQRLESLRSLLYGAPSIERWSKLCSFVDHWPRKEGLDVGLAYSCTHLDAWPDRLRMAPIAWWKRALSGQHDPRWSLVRALAPQTRAVHPNARTGVNKRAQVLRDVLAHPALERITCLEFEEDALGLTGLRVLMDWEGLSRIVDLRLGRNRLGVRALALLASFAHFDSLKTLGLAGNQIDASRVATLAQAPWFRALDTLLLSGNHLHGAMGDLFASGAFPHLRHLDLRQNQLDDRDMAQFGAHSESLPHLHTLTLGYNRVSDKGLRQLFVKEALPALRHLDLVHNDLGPGTGIWLAQWPGVGRWESLELRGNRLGTDGIAALAQSTHMGNLARLDVMGNRTGPGAIEAMLRAKSLSWDALHLEGVEKITRFEQLLCVSPSVQGWNDLMSLLGSFHDGALLTWAIERAEPVLQHWPDPLRKAPAHWRATRRGPLPSSSTEPPLWRLIRAFEASVDTTAQAISMVQNPHWANVTWLKMGMGHEQELFQAVGKAKHFRNLVYLDLSHNRPGVAGARALAQSKSLGALRALGLRRCQLEPAALEALGKGPLLAQIEQLWLSENPVDAQGIYGLAKGARPHRLRGLDLSQAHLWEEGAIALSDWLDQVPLETLGLSHCGVRDRGLEALVQRVNPERLRTVGFQHNALRDSGIEAMVKAGWFHFLETCMLQSNHLTHRGLAHLARTSFFQRQHIWDGFEHNPLGARGAAVLAQVPATRVDTLVLRRCQLDDEAAQSLAKAPWFSALRTLDLSYNKISDRGFEALVDGLEGSGLQRLELRNNQLSDRAMEALGNAPHLWQTMQELDLSHNFIGPRGIQGLAQQTSITSLQRLNLNANPLGQRGGMFLRRAPWLEQLQYLQIAHTGMDWSTWAGLRSRMGRWDGLFPHRYYPVLFELPSAEISSRTVE